MSTEANEQEAVRTTIVGGRPPGSGRSNVNVPRGIEVLVKKAVVDDDFRELLFDRRGGAAAAIELELDAAEDAMLSAIPKEQLAQIIAQTTVPDEQRRIFLGRIATAMLAVLGASLAGCKPAKTRGIQSDIPETRLAKADPATPVFKLMGNQPDHPEGIRTNAPPSGIWPTPPRTNQPPAKPPANNNPGRPKSPGNQPPQPQSQGPDLEPT